MYSLTLVDTGFTGFIIIGSVLALLLVFSFLYVLYKNYKNSICEKCKSKNIEVSKRNYSMYKSRHFETTYTCQDCGHIRKETEIK